MIEICFILAVLASNLILVFIGKKLNMLTIIMQLVGAIVMAPIISINFPNINIAQIANSEIIKKIYEICFVILMAYILHDNIDCNYQKKDMQLVIPSFFLPFISGIICSIVWFGSFQIQQAIVFGIIFSITAVPVLYMYLKGMNYNAENTKFFIQAAIMIDIISWIAHSLVSDFHYSIVFLVLGSGLLAYITKKINPKLSGIILLIVLMIASHYKSNILLVGVIYVLTASYLKISINLILSEKSINCLNNYLFVPLLLFVGLAKVNWSGIHPNLDIKLLLLIFIPLISKTVGNYIGLTLLKKEDRFSSSILLNTRGLTEIVFLNLVFSQKIIDSYTYIIFLIMSLICTLLPVFFCKKQTH